MRPAQPKSILKRNVLNTLHTKHWVPTAAQPETQTSPLGSKTLSRSRPKHNRLKTLPTKRRVPPTAARTKTQTQPALSSAGYTASNRTSAPSKPPTYTESSRTPAAPTTPGRTSPAPPTRSPHIHSGPAHPENTCRSNKRSTSPQSQHPESTPESSSPSTSADSYASTRTRTICICAAFQSSSCVSAPSSCASVYNRSRSSRACSAIVFFAQLSAHSGSVVVRRVPNKVHRQLPPRDQLVEISIPRRLQRRIPLHRRLHRQAQSSLAQHARSADKATAPKSHPPPD